MEMFPTCVMCKHEWQQQTTCLIKHQTDTAVPTFPLLDLPVECVVNIVSYIEDLRHRFCLYISRPEFRQVFANPKSCDGLVDLEIDVYLYAAEKCKPDVVVEYCEERHFIVDGEPYKREDVLLALRIANMCTRRLRTELYVGHSTRLMIAIVLDFMKHNESSFVGSELTLKLEVNDKQQMSVPTFKVTQLLSALRARDCTVDISLVFVPTLKLTKKADKLSDLRHLLSVYPFCSVAFDFTAHGDGHPNTLLVDVPGFVDPATPVAALGDSLRHLRIFGKYIRSTVLNQMLHAFTQLRSLTCSLIYETDTSEDAWAYHMNMRKLSIQVVIRDGETTTPGECDYYRSLLNPCPNVTTVYLYSSGTFSHHFLQTALFTWAASRQRPGHRGPLLRFTCASANPVPQWIASKVERERPECKTASGHISLEVNAQTGTDQVLSLLPASLASALRYLGAEVNRLHVTKSLNSLSVYFSLAGDEFCFGLVFQ